MTRNKLHTVGVPRISANVEIIIAELLADALAEDMPYQSRSAMLSPLRRTKTQVRWRVMRSRSGILAYAPGQTHDISTRGRIGPTLVL